jgi:hypothetical protein
MSGREGLSSARASVALLAAMVLAGGCGGSEQASSRPSADASLAFEVQVRDGIYHVGQYEVDNAAGASAATALSALDAAFGGDDHCGLLRKKLTASWPSLGAVADLAPQNGRTDASSPTVCRTKQSLMVLRLRLSDPRWHTDIGLSIGDSEARLLQLYPGAKPSRKDSEMRGWRVVDKPVQDDSDISFPALVAVMAHGKVSQFVVVLTAQDA